MFKIQDLMIDVLHARGGGGGVMMPTPTEPTPPSPISPVAATAVLSPKFQVIDKVIDTKGFDLAVLDNVALEVGRAVIGARVAAYCTQDMATCDNNERISPWASIGTGLLESADFGILRDQVLQASDWVAKRESVLEDGARRNAKELLPRLEAAVDELRQHTR